MLKLVSPAGVEKDKVFLDRNSATLGRNEDNSLVLEDIKKYISSHHAVIDFRAPDYFITDISTNGVFINDKKAPVGNGNNAKLNDGDQLHIGDYLIEVRVDDEQLAASEITSKPSLNEAIDFLDDPFAELDTDPVQNLIEENQLIPPDWNEKGSDSDPFDIPVDHFDSGIKEQSYESEPGVEPPPVFKEAFQPIKAEKQQPVVEEALAENWFEKSQVEEQTPTKELFPEDFFLEQKVPDETPPESILSDQQLEESDNQIEKVIDKENPTNTTDFSTTIIENFLTGAGLDNSGIDESLTAETFYIIGRVLRASVQGTMDVLIGRAKIKNEMHLDATMIRSGENNPIKFSVSAEEALRKLLSPQDAGYLKAEEAIEEAFDDIRSHQFSVISGMQTALLEVLEKFDPKKLEQQLHQQSPISASIPVHKQAKLWGLFEILYDDIQHEATDNFYHLFGQAFAEAYEQQINKIKKSKNESPF